MSRAYKRKPAQEADVTTERIRQRLEILGIPNTTASELAGLERGYLSDFLTGKKKSMNHTILRPLAEVLQCSVGFLIGESEDITIRERATLPLAGVVEVGAWRKCVVAAKPSELLALPNWPAEDQAVYEVRGSGADSEAPDGSFVQIVTFHEGTALQDGKLYVVAERSDGLRELTLRRARKIGDNFELWAPTKSEVIEPISYDPGNSAIKIIGTVVRICSLTT